MERFESARCAGLYANKSVHSPKFGPSDGNEVRAPRIEKCRNLVASRNAPFQAWFAARHGGNYGLAMALVAGVTAVVLIIWTALGPERRDVDFVEEARKT